jgi:hypothetical protein
VDPCAAARIARGCGYLPLALSLITGHIRRTPGWTLTDHADRLDERRHDLRLDTGVELALDGSYQHLPADQRRLLRLLALHPGRDFDAYAAAALADIEVAAAQVLVGRLRGEHLIEQTAPGRYHLHDLVRAYAITRAGDEERPSERRAALIRLFDHYLATADAAYGASGIHNGPASEFVRTSPSPGKRTGVRIRADFAVTGNRCPTLEADAGGLMPLPHERRSPSTGGRP